MTHDAPARPLAPLWLLSAMPAGARRAERPLVPVLLIGGLHVSAAAFGIYGAMPPIGYVIGNYITTQLGGRVSQRRLIGGAALCSPPRGPLLRC